jgi:hypothetical protein
VGGCGQAEDQRVPLPELPPRCACGGLLRPDVVWFGESLDAGAVSRAFGAAESAEVVLVIGTSSLVFPAAALPQAARASGAFVVEVNPERTPLSALADVSPVPGSELLPAPRGGGVAKLRLPGGTRAFGERRASLERWLPRRLRSNRS